VVDDTGVCLPQLLLTGALTASINTAQLSKYA